MGVRTTSWGGPLWHAMFCMAVNYEDHPSAMKRQLYLDYFALLGYMLPCIYCRQYYEECKLVVPLEAFIDNPRLEHPVVYWLYCLKDLVNKKLIKQERQCYHREASKVDCDSTLTEATRLAKKQLLQEQLFYTRPSPPFQQVLDYYKSLKSSCETTPINRNLQSCRHIPSV